MGLGVLGTGGGTLSGFEPTSGLGGGIRILWGSGGPLLWPGEDTGNLPGPLGDEKGLADVALPPGGKIGGRLPPESEGQGENSVQKLGIFKETREVEHLSSYCKFFPRCYKYR